MHVLPLFTGAPHAWLSAGSRRETALGLGLRRLGCALLALPILLSGLHAACTVAQPHTMGLSAAELPLASAERANSLRGTDYARTVSYPPPSGEGPSRGRLIAARAVSDDTGVLLFAIAGALYLILRRFATESARREAELRDVNRRMPLARRHRIRTHGPSDHEPQSARQSDHLRQHGVSAANGLHAQRSVGAVRPVSAGPETSPDAERALRSGFDERKPATVEAVLYRKGGTKFWAEVTLAPVFNDTGAAELSSRRSRT